MSPVPLATDSAKPRVLIVTHHLPYAFTLLKPHVPTRSKSLSTRNGDKAAFLASLREHNSWTGVEAEQGESLGGESAGPYWRLDHRRGHSALYAGIESLKAGDEYDVVHIGWTGLAFDEDKHVVDAASLSSDVRGELTRALLTGYKSVPVFVDDKISQGHYEGYCKSGTYPLV